MTLREQLEESNAQHYRDMTASAKHQATAPNEANRLLAAVHRRVAGRTCGDVESAWGTMTATQGGGQQPPAGSRPAAPTAENDPNRLTRAVERMLRAQGRAPRR
jgi:hypothetical protein